MYKLTKPADSQKFDSILSRVSKEKVRVKSATRQAAVISRHSLTESFAGQGAEPTGVDRKRIIERIIGDLDSDISEEEVLGEDQNSLLQLPELRFIEDQFKRVSSMEKPLFWL